jgi:hypothetical protein
MAVVLALGVAAGCGVTEGMDPDAGMDAALPVPPGATVFAHTDKALYRMNTETLEISLVGNFGGAFTAADSMTDLAVDATGLMIGISFTQIYRIDQSTAAATLIGAATLQQAFNGLSFVPSELALGTKGPDILVASRNTDGRIFQIDLDTGAVSQLGDMGPYMTSGDIVGVHGFGMVATVTGPAPGGDVLVRLAPKTFAATPIGAGTGVTSLWGMGYWKEHLYGFASGGNFVELDISTGRATPIRVTPQAWWGAAVTTAAPRR